MTQKKIKMKDLINKTRREVRKSGSNKNAIAEQFNAGAKVIMTKFKKAVSDAKNKLKLAESTTPIGKEKAEYEEQQSRAKNLRLNKINILDQRSKAVQIDIKTNENELRNLSQSLYNSSSIHKPIWFIWEILSNWGYIATLALIAFAEMPLNRVIFQLLGEGRNFTTMLALAVGVLIAFLSHITGHFLHKTKGENRKKAYSWVIVISLFAFVGILSGVIGYLRSMYFVEMNQEESVNPYIMGFLNFLFYIGGVVIAYLYADTNRLSKADKKSYRMKYNEWHNLKQSKKQLQEKYDDVDKAFNTELDNLSKNFATRIASVSGDTDLVDQTYIIEQETILAEEKEIFNKNRKYYEDFVEYLLGKGAKIKKISFLLVISMLFFASCDSPIISNHNDVGILVDVSESNFEMSGYFNDNSILELMDLSLRDKNSWINFGTVYTSKINAMNRNQINEIGLIPPVSSGDYNPLMRKKDVENFVEDISNEINSFTPAESNGTSILIPLFQMASKMKNGGTVIIVSDLMENTEKLNFYKSNLQKINNITSKMNNQIDKNLSLYGFTIYLLFKSADDKTLDRDFSKASPIWKTFLESKGANVIIAPNL